MRKKSKDEAQAIEMLWKVEEEKYKKTKRQQILREWCDYYQKLALSHRKLSEENEARAKSLFEEESA
jgi:hypothetical protein